MTKFSIIMTIQTILLCLFHTPVQASLRDSVQWYDRLYKEGKITTRDFLLRTDMMINKEFEQGRLFDRDELIQIIEPYKRVAWSADSLSVYRINYYILLSNNANYANREGESVYFLEKAEKEIFTHFGQRSLLVAGQKCNTYWDKRNYKKIIETYKEYEDYLQRFPTLIEKKGINLNIGISYINVMLPVVAAYSHLADTAKVLSTVSLAEDIYTKVAAIVPPSHANMLTVNFYQHHLYYYRDFFLLDDKEKSQKLLQEMDILLHTPEYQDNPIIGTLLPKLHTAKVEYFLRYNNTDSARHYLDKLKDNAADFGSHYYTIHRFEANLLANKGLYKEAYEEAIRAAKHIDSIQGILVDDIDEMLYAHTAAEEGKALLLAAEQKERQRNIAVLIAASICLLIFLSFYLHHQQKSIKTQKLISKLNQEANLQVAVLQEIKNNIRTEEQQKLARDLHDTLGGTLAAIKHHLLHIDHESLHTVQREQIQHIESLIERAYSQARHKSHHLFEGAIVRSEDTYLEHLTRLVRTALPPDHYHSQIEIDKMALAGIPIDIRINMLRVVQEVLTNIIKHANAKQVNLSIYTENKNQLFICIENDGKIFNPDKIKGTTFGLDSIHKRIQEMNGSIRFETGSIGMETTIIIPIANNLENKGQKVEEDLSI